MLPTDGVLDALLQPDWSRDIRVLNKVFCDAPADLMSIDRAVFVVYVDPSAVDGLEYSRDGSRALVIDTALYPDKDSA